MVNPTERRKRLRSQLQSDTCIRPASIFDPLSGRIAQQIGFEIGMLGGSVASAVLLGAPDVAVMTLTELAGQVARIGRACDVSMVVDADDGYGNALNAMRTVRELESAGASGLTIEDTVLPRSFGAGNAERLVSAGEMNAKLSAAVAARQDQETVIFGRTHAINAENLDSAIERVRSYSQTGVDGIFLMGVTTVEQLKALNRASSLPLMLGTTPWSLDNDTLASNGVRIVLRGHTTLGATVWGIHQALSAQVDGDSGRETELQPPSELMDIATGKGTYNEWGSKYL